MTDISAAEREAYQSVAYPTVIVSHMTPDRIRAGGLLHGWPAPDPLIRAMFAAGPHAIALRHARLAPKEPQTAALSDMAGMEIIQAKIAEALADIAGRRVFLA